MSLKLSSTEPTQKKLTYSDLKPGDVFLCFGRDPEEPFIKVFYEDCNSSYAIMLSTGKVWEFFSDESIDEVLRKGTMFVIE